MLRHQRVVLEQEDQQCPGKKAADMGPERHATRFRTQRRQPAKQLQEKPVAQHEVRWYHDLSNEESEKHQHVHPHSRVQHDVCAHDTTDRPGGADHGNSAGGIDENLGTGGGESREEIEQQVPHVAHRIFDVITEECSLGDRMRQAENNFTHGLVAIRTKKRKTQSQPANLAK